MKKIILASLLIACSFNVNAAVNKITEAAFTPAAGLITFSEFALGTKNPVYTPELYGGSVGAPTVNFGGWFIGQFPAGSSPNFPCPGALSWCVVGSPTVNIFTPSIRLDQFSVATFITPTSTYDNPTSPDLSGTPLYFGPISVLFSVDVAGVGLQGIGFDAIGSTAITAYARDGSLLGTFANEGIGSDFIGLATKDGLAKIAGLQIMIEENEPRGYAIDNLRFGIAGQVVTTAIPEPETYAMFLAGLGLLGFAAKRQKRA